MNDSFFSEILMAYLAEEQNKNPSTSEMAIPSQQQKPFPNCFSPLAKKSCLTGLGFFQARHDSTGKYKKILAKKGFQP